MKLSLVIGKEIGRGRVGRVYEANVDMFTSSPALKGAKLPPLVVKVSRKDKASALLPEAQNYVDMQIMQGVVIPRCYGVFTAAIPTGCHFSPWQEDGIDDNNSTPEDIIQRNLLKDALPRDTISILVLERVGGYIPVKKYSEADQCVVHLCHILPNLSTSVLQRRALRHVQGSVIDGHLSR